MTQELTKVQKMHIWLFDEGAITVCTSDIIGRALDCVMNGHVVSEVTNYTVAYLSFYGMKFYCLKGEEK